MPSLFAVFFPDRDDRLLWRNVVSRTLFDFIIQRLKPLTDDGLPLNPFGAGTIQVQTQRAALLICYKQLLVWPFLYSAFDHPTVLITAANDYWAKHTRIPEIQGASAGT
jgi:hypothetical protein